MKKQTIWSLVALLLAFCFALSGCSGLVPDTTEGGSAPTTTLTPVTTETPQTSTAPETTLLPETTAIPTTTESPTTTEAPITENAPVTTEPDGALEVPALTKIPLDLSVIPPYDNSPYVAVNNNIPTFSANQLTTTSYEFYSERDSMGRCGLTVACIGIDLMPTEDRGSISSVKPTGWHSVQYDIVEGDNLYNRCHLIGFQLSGENANWENLITGTRYLNVQGMLPFENLIADYVKETQNHVLYRVTPIFEGDNLVASGVHMEAYSIEDEGEGISFNVYAYNVQPGITIDYATGESHLTDDGTGDNGKEEGGEEATYILNTNTHKFHYPTCSSVSDMKESNKKEYVGTREELIEDGYDPCGRCNP